MLHFTGSFLYILYQTRLTRRRVRQVRVCDKEGRQTCRCRYALSLLPSTLWSTVALALLAATACLLGSMVTVAGTMHSIVSAQLMTVNITYFADGYDCGDPVPPPGPTPAPHPTDARCTYMNADTCDGDDLCIWCRSAAVGSACFTRDQAAKLPPSIFQCSV